MINKPMRVAMVELFGIGGTGDYTACLAEALASDGTKVTVLTSTEFEPMGAPPNYEIRRVFSYTPSRSKFSKGVSLVRALRRTHEAVQSIKPDVLHVQGTVLPVLERRMYGALRNQPKVCTVHDARLHEWRPWRGSLPRFYSVFDHLICHSEATRQQVRRGNAYTPIGVIPHGIYSPFVREALDSRVARQCLAIAPDARVILFFGYIRKYKGLEVLLEALARVRPSDKPVVAVVAGRPLYDVAPSIARATKLRLPVEWRLNYVPRNEVSLYFSAADVVAMPYVSTSDSGAFELAAAFRKPVVVTAVGGLTEAFNRYGFGAIVPPGDVDALARALMGSYRPKPADKVANSWERVAAQTRDIYSMLTQRPALVDLTN